MNARQTFKTEEPIFVENYDLIKNYHEMLDQLLAAEAQAFETNFDESIEQAAEELERISSIEFLQDLDVDFNEKKTSTDTYEGLTRVSDFSKNDKPTVVVFLADHSKGLRKKKAFGQ